MLLADLYTGPPELTPLRLFTVWKLDLPTVLLVVLLGGGYAWGLLRVRAARAPWPRNRTLTFGAGVLLVGLVGCSFLGVYSPVLFWVRATQNMLSLMVVPLLLAIAARARGADPDFQEFRTQRLDLLAGLGAHVITLDLRTQPARGGDRLQAGHAGANHQHLRGADRAGGGGQHREKLRRGF
ncbi:MAG: cytochrome c oxidase assembly protein, partial [Mycobacteriaceae bacterium]